MPSRPHKYSQIKHIVTQCALFQDFPDETLANMFCHFQSSTWKAGGMIDPQWQDNSFYLILEGRVKIEYTDPATGKNLTLFIHGEGDVFDIVFFIGKNTNDTVAIALDNLTVLSIPNEKVKCWINCYPGFNTNFLSYTNKKMRDLEANAASLATANSFTRLARLILKYTNTQQLKNDFHSVKLIHDFTNDALAKMIGSSRQVVNKHLQLLRTGGVLCPLSKDLVVTDLAKLKRYSLR